MKIAVGWDHRGRCFRDKVAGILAEMGHEFIDMGAQTDESSDYPDFAIQVSEAVSNGDADRGVLMCGTGIGMSMAANKVAGVRAGVVHDMDTARLSRQHNDANVLCVGEGLMEGDAFQPILDTWLTTEFEGGRHGRRVEKIMAYERRNSEC
jgi:ribose 5-phosphate isomerase B